MILSTQTDVMLRVHGPIEGVEKLCRAGYDGIDYSLFHDAMAQIESLGDGWRAQADAQRMAALSFGATFVQAHAQKSAATRRCFGLTVWIESTLKRLVA